MPDFVDALIQATALIPEEYFYLSVAKKPAPVLRERVYCYELYHQLRLKQAQVGGCTLSAEPDKRGNPAFKRALKPDLILHLPGSHNENVAVVEVEWQADKRHLTKDLTNLKAFAAVGYGQLVLLLFGRSTPPWASLEKAAAEAALSLAHIHILLHKAPGQQAIRLDPATRLTPGSTGLAALAG
jgi:hypothetical protein